MRPLCSNFKDFKKTVILGESGRASAGWGASAGSLALPRQTQIAAPLQPNANFFKIFLKWLRGVDFFMDLHISATPLSHFKKL